MAKKLTQDQAIDNLVSLFEEEVTDMVASARQETVRMLLDRLSITNGVIDRTKGNAAILGKVSDSFTKAMRKAGYNALVEEFVNAFNGQFVYFDDILTDLGKAIDRDLSVKFGVRDKALFLQQQVQTVDMLHQEVAMQAQAAQRQASFSVGNVKASDLTAMIAEKLDITSGRASALADTALSTFQRTVADRGYQQVEKQLAGDTIELVYRYGGPADKLTRARCAEWLAGSKKGWTREYISKLDNGQLPNVFVTCGGFRCRHRWTPKARVREDVKADTLD